MCAYLKTAQSNGDALSAVNEKPRRMDLFNILMPAHILLAKAPQKQE